MPLGRTARRISQGARRRNQARQNRQTTNEQEARTVANESVIIRNPDGSINVSATLRAARQRKDPSYGISEQELRRRLRKEEQQAGGSPTKIDTQTVQVIERNKQGEITTSPTVLRPQTAKDFIESRRAAQRTAAARTQVAREFQARLSNAPRTQQTTPQSQGYTPQRNPTTSFTRTSPEELPNNLQQLRTAPTRIGPEPLTPQQRSLAYEQRAIAIEKRRRNFGEQIGAVGDFIRYQFTKPSPDDKLKGPSLPSSIPIRENQLLTKESKSFGKQAFGSAVTIVPEGLIAMGGEAIGAYQKTDLSLKILQDPQTNRQDFLQEVSRAGQETKKILGRQLSGRDPITGQVTPQAFGETAALFALPLIGVKKTTPQPRARTIKVFEQDGIARASGDLPRRTTPLTEGNFNFPEGTPEILKIQRKAAEQRAQEPPIPTLYVGRRGSFRGGQKRSRKNRPYTKAELRKRSLQQAKDPRITRQDNKIIKKTGRANKGRESIEALQKDRAIILRATETKKTPPTGLGRVTRTTKVDINLKTNEMKWSESRYVGKGSAKTPKKNQYARPPSQVEQPKGIREIPQGTAIVVQKQLQRTNLKSLIGVNKQKGKPRYREQPNKNNPANTLQPQLKNLPQAEQRPIPTRTDRSGSRTLSKREQRFLEKKELLRQKGLDRKRTREANNRPIPEQDRSVGTFLSRIEQQTRSSQNSFTNSRSPFNTQPAIIAGIASIGAQASGFASGIAGRQGAGLSQSQDQSTTPDKAFMQGQLITNEGFFGGGSFGGGGGGGGGGRRGGNTDFIGGGNTPPPPLRGGGKKPRGDTPPPRIKIRLDDEDNPLIRRTKNNRSRKRPKDKFAFSTSFTGIELGIKATNKQRKDFTGLEIRGL